VLRARRVVLRGRRVALRAQTTTLGAPCPDSRTWVCGRRVALRAKDNPGGWLSLPTFCYDLRVKRTLLVLAGCSVFLAGCGAASPDCTLSYVLEVSPATATANHSAAPPGNQQQFRALSQPTAGPGCAIPAYGVEALPVWTNPDPLAISISSAQNQTNGLATCLTATDGAVTLTATVGTGQTAQTKTVSLTCQ
jgi:hypothetical protein